MRTLFLRITVVLFLTLLVGLSLIVFVSVSAYLDRLMKRHISATERVHSFVVQDLKRAPESQWGIIIDRHRALLGYEIDVVDELPAEGFSSIIPGNDASFRQYVSSNLKNDKVTTWWPVADDKRWLRYSITYDSELESEDVLLLALLFVALPLVLYLNLRPIARKITDLSDVARAYTNGQLDARSTIPAPPPLEQLADNIHKMARALNFKIQEQKIMTSAISHELKTPLTRMRMANDLALREDDPAAWRSHLTDLDEDLTMLEKVISETLVLSQLTLRDTPLRLSAVPLRELLVKCVAEVSPEDPSIEIAVPGDIQVLANHDALKRVFVNIILNAVRHRKRRVRISAVTRDDRYAITIDDDGPGIPSKSRERVFMPFGRAEDSRSRVTGSTGIGLAIASVLVEKCGGSIDLSDAPIGGARFRVTLPAASRGANKS